MPHQIGWHAFTSRATNDWGGGELRIRAVLIAALIGMFALASIGAEGCDSGGGGGKDTGLDRDAGGGDTASSSEPEQSADFAPREFSGSGSTNIGTVKVPGDAVLEWTNEGDPQFRQFLVYDDAFGLNVTSSATSGKSAMPAGTYPNIQVAGDDKWTITIRPAG